MKSLNDWIDFYLPLIDAEGGSQKDIIEFEREFNIKLTEEHKWFLINFIGNNVQAMFLTPSNISFILDEVYEIYLEFRDVPDESPKPGFTIIGSYRDLSGICLAVNSVTGYVYETYAGGVLDFYSGGIKKFVAQMMFFYFNYGQNPGRKFFGLKGYRVGMSNENMMTWLTAHGFEVEYDLCDRKKVCATKGEYHFFSDFNEPTYRRESDRNFGFIAFEGPESDMSQLTEWATELGDLMALKTVILNPAPPVSRMSYTMLEEMPTRLRNVKQ